MAGLPFWLALAFLAAANVLNNWLASGAYVLTCVATALALLALARWDGLSRTELGLGPGALRAGLRWGLVLTGIVLAGYLLVYAVPAARVALVDDRAASLSAGELAWQALIRVPLGTVLLEEVAFRGVLWAMIARRRGPLWATGLSSAVFGLWHVLPSLNLTDTNAAADAIFGAGPVGQLIAVVVAVLGTATAGVVFCEVRRRSGSLLAPAALHWAFNGWGYLFAWVAA